MTVADRMTNVAPGVHREERAGVVWDGGAWTHPDQVGRYSRPRDYAESCVPVGIDPWQPSRAELEGRDRPEIPDHLGGFLRAVQLTPADQEADDDWMLSGDPLPDGEDEAAAARRRRLREAAFRWGVRR